MIMAACCRAANLLVATLLLARSGAAVSQPCAHGRPLPPAPPQPRYEFPDGAKNVLLIISDDLRPDLREAYGQAQMITPHLDALSRRATVFNRAFCQQAICGPSRNSFLSGRRPQRTQSWNFIDSFREPPCGTLGNESARIEDGRGWQSFPGWFKNHGYVTLGSGKTYHPGIPPASDGNRSWSSDRPYVDAGDKSACTSDHLPNSAKWTQVCPDSGAFDKAGYTDFENLAASLENLNYAHNVSKRSGAPFFVAFGLHRPHLPFHFPSSFPDENGTIRDVWLAYGPTEEVALPTHASAPDGMPGLAFTYEMDGKTQVCVESECVAIPGPDNAADPCPFCGPALPSNMTRALRKGYYGAVSWADYCIGRLLAELARLGHDDDTVVAVVGDHGWQLGEHNIWGKHTNFELAARVPLIVRAPGQSSPLRTDALVESVDIFPTVSALAGLGPPPDLDGTDLSPLWQNTASELKEAAFSEYPRCAPPDAPWTPEHGASAPQSCVWTPRSNFTAIGYSVRTESWRCTLWLWWDGERLAGDFDREPIAVELYSHQGDDGRDFDVWENKNVAAANPDVVAQHMSLARAHWNATT